MSGKHITILGGSGFVGRSLVAHLANLGHHVKVLTRYKDNARALRVLPQVHVVQGNIHSQAFLARELADSHTVVNLIGILNEFGKATEKFERVHVDLVESIAKTCTASNVKKLVHVSALKADAEEAPSKYLRTKGQAENIIKRQPASSLRWSILQPSVIFGTDDSFVNRFAGILKLPAPVLPLPRAHARFAPVYVEDVVKAIAHCVEHKETDGVTFQLCGPQVFSLKEIVENIKTEIGVKRLVVGMPDVLARMQAAVLGLLPGKPFSSDNYKSLTVHSICDTDGFGRLGIEPRSLGAIMPRYLGNATKSRRYGRMRAKAGRRM